MNSICGSYECSGENCRQSGEGKIILNGIWKGGFKQSNWRDVASHVANLCSYSNGPSYSFTASQLVCLFFVILKILKPRYTAEH